MINFRFKMDFSVSQFFFFLFTDQTAKSRGEDLLPVWRSVWPGSLQPQHYPPALPTSSVQEAAQGQTYAGRHEGV